MTQRDVYIAPIPPLWDALLRSGVITVVGSDSTTSLPASQPRLLQCLDEWVMCVPHCISRALCATDATWKRLALLTDDALHRKRALPLLDNLRDPVLRPGSSSVVQIHLRK